MKKVGSSLCECLHWQLINLIGSVIGCTGHHLKRTLIEFEASYDNLEPRPLSLGFIELFSIQWLHAAALFLPRLTCPEVKRRDKVWAFFIECNAFVKVQNSFSDICGERLLLQICKFVVHCWAKVDTSIWTQISISSTPL